ncbi:cadherin-like protein 26 isoform X2 [Engraulis encrasicolus]|uniref:cadherin-like protein 26 isoform X2 n=1 Tax=Engraulis encrasicolus TaxID=184585 RepID=UPI002FD00322
MENALLACFAILVVELLDTGLARGLSRPKRSWLLRDEYELYEGNPGPYPMLLRELPPNKISTITGPGATEDPVGLLRIENQKLYITGPLDYGKYKNISLVYEAAEDGTIDTRLAILIIVLDINDNPPVFSKEEYTATLNESQTQGLVVEVDAIDADEPNTENSTFTFSIVSVSPKNENVRFLIQTKEHLNNKRNGMITFQGCLNYQAPKKVKENKYGMEVGRILVTDEDIQGTPSWRARFSLHGDPGGYFKISTDPKTNEGIITIEKPLDYEEVSRMHMSVTVENEEPLFCCEKGRDQCSHADSNIQLPVVVIVENDHEPPVFDPPRKDKSVEENIAVGTYLEQLTAKDPENKPITYRKGQDPEGWVSVDSKTGKITTAKHLDRESPYVRSNRYIVTIYAVEVDNTPLTEANTATATLIIYLIDINDNAPILEQSHIEMCMSHGPVKTLITAIDKDEKHHGPPFLFEVLNNDNGHWRLEPASGNMSGNVWLFFFQSLETKALKGRVCHFCGLFKKMCAAHLHIL